jgi:hypothetical protein
MSKTHSPQLELDSAVPQFCVPRPSSARRASATARKRRSWFLSGKLKPWLIEVNHLSSFGTDSPLDKKVKTDLITDTFNLLNLSVKRKRK